MSSRYIPKEIKINVKNRAKGICEYCKSLARYSTQPYVIEHIIPLAKNGKSEMDNLAYSCGGCNNHKYTKTEAADPVDGIIVPLFNPRKDDWNNHFGWDEKFLEVIGLTPTGRATVNSLRLNRPELLNLRRITKLTGEHPPLEYPV